MSLYDDICEQLASMNPSAPRATQVKAGSVAEAAIRAMARPATLNAVGPESFLGIPVTYDEAMPPDTWKIIDQYGDTMGEGTV